MPSDEARRRIMAGEPVGTGGGRARHAHRRWCRFWPGSRPASTPTPSSPLLALATLNTTARQEENSLSLRVDHRLSDAQSFYVRYLFSDGDLNTPDRTVTPRRVRAKQRPQNVVFNYQSLVGRNVVNEFKVGYNKPTTSAQAFADPGIRSGRRVDVAERSPRRRLTPAARPDRAQRPADSRDERLVDDRLDLRALLAVFRRRADLDQGRAHLQVRRRVPAAAVRLPVPWQHGDHLQQHQRFHRQHSERGCSGARLAGVQARSSTT